MFRGVGFARGAARLGALVVMYAGVLGVLFAAGMVVHGWLGWAVLATPLAMLGLLRIWGWHRVSVTLSDGMLRYEGASPRTDFEVPLAHLRGVSLPARTKPLVLILEGDEPRVCPELSPRAAGALARHLVALGVEPR